MTVAFISGLCCNFWKNSCKSKEVQFVPYSDTVVVLKATIDTLEVERIKTKTIYEKQIDTIYLYDSVAIDSAYTKAINRLQQLERTGFFKH
jgi:Tfp pilus assembly protein PilN